MLELTPLGLNIYWRENHADLNVVKNIAQALNAIVEEAHLETGVSSE